MNYSDDIKAAALIAAASPRGATYGDVLSVARAKHPAMSLVTVRRWAASRSSDHGFVLAEVRTTECAELERRRLFLTEAQAYASGFTIAYIVGNKHVGRREELLQAIQKHGFIDSQTAAAVMDCSVEYAQRHLSNLTSQGFVTCNGRLGEDRRWYIGPVPNGDLLPPLRDTLLKLAARPEGVSFDVSPWGRSTVAKALSEFFTAGVMVRRRAGYEARYFTRREHADAWKAAQRITGRREVKVNRFKKEASRCNSAAKSIRSSAGAAPAPVKVAKAAAQPTVITPDNVKRTVCPPAPHGRFHVDPSEVSGVFSALGPGQYLKGRDESPFTTYLKGL